MQIRDTDTKTTPGTIWVSRNVYDAFELKEFGTYLRHMEKGKRDVDQCATLPSGEEHLCHSENEFTQLVKVYMDPGSR